MANCSQCGRKLPAFSFKKTCPWCVQHEAAQRGEVVENEKQRVMPAPWIRRESSISLTQIIFGANVAVFLGMAFAAQSVTDFSGLDPRAWGANFGPWTLSGQWWRLITYMFVHANIFHIGFNMWCLWNLGALCESLYGRWTFLSVYLVTGIAAGLASLVWHPDVLSVGASGAIFGLAGALIASFALGEFSLPSIAIRGTLRSLVFFVGFNVLLGFGFNIFGGSLGNIDNAAHIGGLISGLLLGALIALLAPEHDNPLRRAGVLLFAVLLIGTSAFGILRWRGFPLQMGRDPLSSRENLDHTIAQLQKETERHPKNTQARYDLARAYFTLHRFSDAESELNRILELQPKNIDVQLDLGSAYLSDGQARQAQEVFSKVLAQEPNDIDAHFGLGMALADQQDHADAIKEYRTVLQLGPQSRGVFFRMGLSQAQLQQYDDAIASYLREKDLSGDDYDLENALADAYQAKGMTEQARDARKRAGQLKGQNID